MTLTLMSNLKVTVNESDPSLKFTKANYIVQVKSASLYLCVEGRHGYINGKVTKLEDFDMAFK